MKHLTLNQIKNKIKKTKFSKFDLVVAIGKGGIYPAFLVAQHLNLPLRMIKIKYRDENHKPLHKKPKVKKSIKIKNKNILIVDDVSRTGATLIKAKDVLKENKTKTFVINGKADYSLYNFKECVKWPWH